MWVCLRLAERPVSHDWGTVALLVGELATNAVVHAATDRFTVRLDFSDGIEAAVRDHDPATPHARQDRPENCHGHGLALVAMTADAWGTREAPDGKWVWFHLGSPALDGRPAAGN